MPVKNPDEYRKYMNNYMKSRYRKKNGIPDDPKPKKEIDFEEIKAKAQNLETGTKSASDTTKVITSLAKEFGEDTPENKEFISKIEKYISLGEKFLPIALQFIKGFAERQQELQLHNANQVQATSRTTAPAGWEGLTPMQRISKKYASDGTISTWYAQGEQYEAEKNMSVNTPTFQINETPTQQYQQAPTSLKELSQRHPDPPMLSNQEPKQEEPKQEEPKQEPQKKQEQTNMEKETQKLVEDLRKDNEVYLKLALDHINKMTTIELKKQIENQTLFNPIIQFKDFVPTQTKQMILTIDQEYLEKMLKTHCREKFEYLKNKELLDKAFQQFVEVQEKFKPKKEGV
jgi:hypothetical protein